MLISCLDKCEDLVYLVNFFFFFFFVWFVVFFYIFFFVLWGGGGSQRGGGGGGGGGSRLVTYCCLFKAPNKAWFHHSNFNSCFLYSGADEFILFIILSVDSSKKILVEWVFTQSLMHIFDH
jgi:hypothetical protein